MKLFKGKLNKKKLTIAHTNNINAPIKVLGSGCTRCHALLENTKQALTALSLNLEIGYITDFAEMAKLGVMTTPALMVNDKIVSVGKLLTTDEITKLLPKGE